MKIAEIFFGVVALVLILSIPWLVADFKIKGHDGWESILLALGMTLPIIVPLAVAVFILNRKQWKKSA